MSVWSALRERLDQRGPLAKVAVNLVPRRAPYGGGNQFVRHLQRDLERHGYEVVFRLDDDTDAAVLIDGRRELTQFGADEVSALKKARPSLVCIHRVNECDLRKGTLFMDSLLARTNAVADHTVFISAWLRDYHAERWFDRRRPHSVILNGADPRVFHPLRAAPLPDQPFRVATHHWSDHPMKGFAEYAELDRAILRGELPDLELWVIGRWPAEIKWESAQLFPPSTGHELADLLRQCHAYITASRWEPGGMHYIEAAQCGLPVAYHQDGGGIVELASRFGVGYRESVVDGVLTLRTRWRELRTQVLEHPPSGDLMCLEYRMLLQRLLAERVVAPPSAD